MPALDPPGLSTFTEPASWRNAAGRVDRSACLAVPCSKVWRDVESDAWRRARTYPQPASGRSKGRRHGPVRHGRIWRLARAVARIEPQLVESLVAQRAAPALWGDHRRRFATTPLGAFGFTGVETIIERWHMHESLNQHLFVCPGCDQAIGKGQKATGQALPGRALKLYLPLCTAGEARDAQLAQRWLERRGEQYLRCGPGDRFDVHAAMVDRYGPLFAPRRLLCRRCLGLRYGEVKLRQPFRRAMFKGDPEIMFPDPDEKYVIDQLDMMMIVDARRHAARMKERAMWERLLAKYDRLLAREKAKKTI